MKLLVSWYEKDGVLYPAVAPVDGSPINLNAELIISDMISQGDLLTEMVQLVKPNFKPSTEPLPWQTEDQVKEVCTTAFRVVNGAIDSDITGYYEDEAIVSTYV